MDKKQCVYAKKCGGCDYQGIDYKEQLAKKQAYMKKLLKPVCHVEPIIGMKDPLHYRHKVHAAFDCTKRGQIVAGVYKKNSHEVVDVESCMIEDEECDRIIRDIKDMLRSFLYDVCECKGEWKMESFIDTTVAQLKEQIGDKGVVLGLSGGVDSSVAAALLSKAVGKQLTCVFVDQGLMRKDEGDFVEQTFTKLFDMNFVRINCQEEFLAKLKGVEEPEEKRHIIGTEFYKVFWDKIREEADGGFFAQGTIYPDCIESGKGNADKIKTHHNKVAMPEDIKFDDVVEPLCDLFKDEVRVVGEKLGIPKELVWRQPFPGPGLGVRIIGEITEEKIKILQDADAVFRDEIAKSGIAQDLSQFFCVLPDVRTVGVMGDHRTYDHLVAIRAVTTDDFMTADFARIPYDVLARVSNRIVNECEHINRVVYDITSKPPGTIEWE